MNGHPRDQAKVSVHCRWPLVTGTDGQAGDAKYNFFLVLISSRHPIGKGSVLDQIGRIKAPDPWTDLTSGCHLGYIYTDPQMTVKAYPHTSVWVPIGCSTVLWVDRAR